MVAREAIRQTLFLLDECEMWREFVLNLGVFMTAAAVSAEPMHEEEAFAPISDAEEVLAQTLVRGSVMLLQPEAFPNNTYLLPLSATTDQTARPCVRHGPWNLPQCP